MIIYDFSENYQLSFQDAASPVMEEMVNFHNYVMIYLTFVTISVIWMLFEIVKNFSKSDSFVAHKYLTHGTVLEFVWTVIPAVMLVGMGFPSFKLLYLMDEVMDPAITLKVTGHQWYWTYEYSDYIHQDGTNMEFDSYMVPEADLEEGQLSLLEVDNQIVVPVNSHVSVMVSSADVIHSWAVPSLGIKMDAIPGSLNQTSFLAFSEGVYYGQCSEICGLQHAFMPIAVKVVSLQDYCTFMQSILEEESEG